MHLLSLVVELRYFPTLARQSWNTEGLTGSEDLNYLMEMARGLCNIQHATGAKAISEPERNRSFATEKSVSNSFRYDFSNIALHWTSLCFVSETSHGVPIVASLSRATLNSLNSSVFPTSPSYSQWNTRCASPSAWSSR